MSLTLLAMLKIIELFPKALYIDANHAHIIMSLLRATVQTLFSDTAIESGDTILDSGLGLTSEIFGICSLLEEGFGGMF